MDHMLISGTEPLSAILNKQDIVKQTRYCKSIEMWCKNNVKHVEAKWDDVNNPQIYNLNLF